MTLPSELEARFGKQPVFSARDARTFLGKKGVSADYSGLMLHNLVKKGRLFRISSGIYTFHAEAQLAGFAFQPFYYGLQDALSLRNLWEQETVPVVITPRYVRSGARTFLGSNYRVRRISRRMFFGFEMKKYGEFWIPVSDAEKTLIDFHYFRLHLPPDALAELKKTVRKKVLESYLKRTPERIAAKVRRAAFGK